MSITQFATKVTKLEGKRISISVAQVSECLKIVNKLTGGILYAVIRLL